jgi:long-chain fatty acid transport protein
LFHRAGGFPGDFGSLVRRCGPTDAVSSSSPAALGVSVPVVKGAIDFRGGMACAAAIATVALSAGSHASSVLETVGAPGVGNGFTARTLSRGADVAYFNPALLPDVPSDLDFGFFVVRTSERIHLSARPAGVDVPDSVYDADLSNGATNQLLWPQPTSKLLQQRKATITDDVIPYAALGMARPIAGKYLVFGLYGLLPANGFLQQKSFFADEREQYFSNQLHHELLGDRLKVTSIALSVGGRVRPWLSWGMGVDLGMATRTQMQIYVPDAANQGNILMTPEIETRIALAPYLGIALRPWERWLVTATAHFPKSWDTSGDNRLRFWDYPYPAGQTAVPQAYVLTQGSEPLRLGLGVATSGNLQGVATWEIGAQGVFTRWSQYRDRHAERPLDPWHDTLNLGFGGSLDWSSQRLFAEVGVAPSPVPDQVGRTNYVDNTRVGLSTGVEVPFTFWSGNFVLAIYVQGQLLPNRSVVKNSAAAHPVTDEVPDGTIDRVHDLPLPGAAGLQTNNPGFPGYSSTGGIFGGGLVLRVLR